MGLLDGVLTGILGGDGNGNTPPPSQPTPPNNGGGLGILPTLSIPVPPLLSPIIPPVVPTPSSSSLSVTAVASTSSPASVSLPLSSSAASSPSSAPISAPPTSTVAPPKTSEQAVTSTGLNGVVQTLTNVVTVDASSSAASSADTTAAPATNRTFLQNKPLSGAVFGIVGLLALILIFTVTTFAMRRRARNRLLDDAVSFDPGLLAAANEAEKGHGHVRNNSFGSATTTGRPVVAAPAAYGNYPAMPQYQEYYGAQYPTAYAAHPAVAAHPQHNIPRVPVPPPKDDLSYR